MGAGWICRNHHTYLVANSLFVSSYIVSVGATSSTAPFCTASGWSSIMRCTTRPPRSWPAPMKVRWPSRAITSTMSFGKARDE